MHTGGNDFVIHPVSRSTVMRTNTFTFTKPCTVTSCVLRVTSSTLAVIRVDLMMLQQRILSENFATIKTNAMDMPTII